MSPFNPGRERYESWFRDRIQSDAGPIETPASQDGVVRVLTSSACPDPVRPVGSRHSMTPCMSAEAPAGSPQRWGTIVDMSGMIRLQDGSGGPGDRSLRVSPAADGKSGTVTVPAGRTFIGVARELDAMATPWAFRVNTELGTLTMGAAACGATKDSSFPGESGQVCADVIGMRLVRPDGTAQDYTESSHPEEMKALRCSYGLFGIVTEVTCRVYPREYIAIDHEKARPRQGGRFSAAELQEHFDRWLGRGGNENAVFLYLFPYRHRIVAEIRKKPATGQGAPRNHSARLSLRNHFWKAGAHDWQAFTELMPHLLKIKLQDAFDKALSTYLDHLLELDKVNPVSQIVDFDPQDPGHRFTFSMWAFPEDQFATILPEYFALCEKHEATFRSGLPHASYHIHADQNSLLSYSRKGTVWTLDPICPDTRTEKERDAWHRFLDEFNDFCSDRGGMPLLNQTPRLKQRHVARAFADCLPRFREFRETFDSHGRMLNAYFAELLRP